MAKPKGVHTEKRYNKLSKLPPRFAKQREQQRVEKAKNKTPGSGLPDEESPGVGTGFMPKIENWDNELANNIPPLSSRVISADIKQDMDVNKSE